MDPVAKIKEWVEEKREVIRLEREYAETLPKGEQELELRLLVLQEALVDEVSKIIEE